MQAPFSTYTRLALALLITTAPVAALAKTPRHQTPPAQPAKAVSNMDIVAVAGDEAISSYDLDSRMRFIITTSELSDTAETRERLRPQVLRSLIDERLQLKEAAKNDIHITDDEVSKAITSIEENRGMPPGAIDKIMQDAHIPKETFRNQIRAQLAWNRLIVRKLRPQVKISESEIELASRRFNNPADKQQQELQIAILKLPIDKPARAGEIRKLAEKLSGEIRKGANFEEVTRHFSPDGKADPFWIRPDQLDPDVAKNLRSATKGMITNPIRTQDGYTIIKVYGMRALNGEPTHETMVKLKEILLRLKPDADGKEADVLLQIGEEVAKHPGTCDEKGIANIQNLQDFNIEVNFNEVLMSELPPALRLIADNLKVGDISTPFASYEGIRLYMLCGKQDVEARPVQREEVENFLLHQKLELEAQKYLRNLRRETYIEIRE